MSPDSNADSADLSRASSTQVPSDTQETLSRLAHELNNPLAAIMGFTQLLLKKHWPADDRAALETINSESVRLASIVQDLLVLSRGRPDPNHAAHALDVLLVAAESTPADTIENLLSTRGHAVITARSSEMALRLARNTSFDVVVCDDRLTTSSGASVAAQLRTAGGCAGARFVTSIPGASTPTQQVDVDALRRLVEGD